MTSENVDTGDAKKADPATVQTGEPARTSPTNSEPSRAQTGEPARTSPTTREPSRAPPNNIFIGKKPLMTYATSALIQLTQSDNIVLKARGMVISRAVDVAEVIVKRLGNNNYEVTKIGIDTERVGEGDDARNVSTIEIIISKK